MHTAQGVGSGPHCAGGEGCGHVGGRGHFIIVPGLAVLAVGTTGPSGDPSVPPKYHHHQPSYRPCPSNGIFNNWKHWTVMYRVFLYDEEIENHIESL